MAAYPGFMTHVTCRLTAKNRDRLLNPTLGNRVWANFTFFTLQCKSAFGTIQWRAEQGVCMQLSGVRPSVCPSVRLIRTPPRRFAAVGPPLVDKKIRGLWGWIELFAGMGGISAETGEDGCEVCGDGSGTGLKSHPSAHV